ncbi:MAG: hypothetical protein K9L86_06985 [Candidatus Omnitrophica bacterium]|nr:hypothetical protein [Candidatus Omnitrophota bacterium]
MKSLARLMSIVLVLSLLGCEPLVEKVQETQEGYQIQKGVNLTVVLGAPLSSNSNKRGDIFITKLKEDLNYKDRVVLAKGVQIRGLVKSATKFEKLGDKASLLLLLDQVVLFSGVIIPVVASLDTDEGVKVIKIPGKAAQDLAIIGASGVMGSLVGKEVLGKNGAEKGLAIGVVSSASAALLSGRKEIKLPVGTELIIKLDESLLIPR